MDVGSDLFHPGTGVRTGAARLTPTRMMVKARRGGRKRLVLIQILVFGGLLLLVKGVSPPSSGVTESREHDGRWSQRRLLQDNISQDHRNCTPPALHEFPSDVFSHQERVEGAVALHVLCAVYMFCALALVCDDYFVPSLEKICERLHLSEDVAGATFMAAGSSAPELFTSIIGVFITRGDVGVGTIVGSAVFNILCIIGVCGLLAGQAVKLSPWPLLRDSSYYTVSIVALIVFIQDEQICWWESLVLVLMYLLYILIMKFSGRAQSHFSRRKKVRLTDGLASSTDLQDCDASVVLLRIANTSALTVDELLATYPHQLSFPEAGMRLMITRHFSPRTRLVMASRMLITERQRRIDTNQTRVVHCTGANVDLHALNGLENGLSGTEPGPNGQLQSGAQAQKQEGPSGPFRAPAGVCNKLWWLTMWPLSLLLFFTVPNCAARRWENWFMVSFITATIWIAGLSYIMVWMVTVIGFTLGIPDVIMGITFLAAGTSIPDCMASVIVARQGLGDMAISNSIGSNVFDILVGLGLPWVLHTLYVDYGSEIHLNSRGLIFSVGLLLASVFVTVLGVHLNKWTLDWRLGLGYLLLYSVFLCFSVLIEFNVFIFVNLPMCRDAH